MHCLAATIRISPLWPVHGGLPYIANMLNSIWGTARQRQAPHLRLGSICSLVCRRLSFKEGQGGGRASIRSQHGSQQTLQALDPMMPCVEGVCQPA